MDLTTIQTFEFLYSLGTVTIISSVVTMIIVEIIKLILKQAKVIKPGMNPTKKDIILSRVGRMVALITYATLYVVDILYIRHVDLVIDIALFTSLLSGSTLTLCISKGIYTGIRQMEKKNTVYEKLEVAEETINKLQGEIKELNVELIKEEPKENKWVLKTKH